MKNCRFLVWSALALLLSSIATSADARNCIEAERVTAEARAHVSSNPDLAEFKLRSALELCSESVAVQYNLALFLYMREKYEAARQQLEEVLLIRPDYSPALNALAFLLLNEPNGGSRAAALAERAVKLEPENEAYQDTLNRARAAQTPRLPDVGARGGVDVDTPPKTNVKRPDGVAIVIGNRHYSNPDVPDVEFASRDAAAVKAFLTTTFGYPRENIIHMTNASLTDFNLVFGTKANHQGKLFNWVVPGESDVFVYYAGHGAPDPATGNAYFVPFDADLNYLSVGGYSLNLLWENLGKLRAKSLTVVLDTCFSGNSEKGPLHANASPGLLNVNAVLRGPKGSVVMTSGDSDQISSWYPEKRHSLFTYYWLTGIGGEADADFDRRITVAEMSQYLREHVPRRARRIANREQTPVVEGDESGVLVVLE